LIPYVIGVVGASIFTGQLISRTDVLSYRTISVIGAALITIGAGLITLWGENTGKAAQIGYMLIAGIGVGCKIRINIFFTFNFFFFVNLLT
jgi:hypothetical protein